MSQNNYGLPSPLTAQAIFDKVALHLLRQGRRSLAEDKLGTGGCAYRGANGTACAVGVLIGDENYTENMEGYSAYQIVRDYMWDLQPFEYLLSDLQSTHDNCTGKEFEVNGLKISLRNVARRHYLSDAVLNTQPGSAPQTPALPDEITRLLGAGRVEA